jgi:hypothetical protein
LTRQFHGALKLIIFFDLPAKSIMRYVQHKGWGDWFYSQYWMIA